MREAPRCTDRAAPRGRGTAHDLEGWSDVRGTGNAAGGAIGVVIGVGATLVAQKVSFGSTAKQADLDKLIDADAASGMSSRTLAEALVAGYGEPERGIRVGVDLVRTLGDGTKAQMDRYLVADADQYGNDDGFANVNEIAGRIRGSVHAATKNSRIGNSYLQRFDHTLLESRPPES